MNNIQSACILIKYEVKEMQYPRKHDIKITSDMSWSHTTKSKNNIPWRHFTDKSLSSKQKTKKTKSHVKCNIPVFIISTVHLNTSSDYSMLKTLHLRDGLSSPQHQCPAAAWQGWSGIPSQMSVTIKNMFYSCSTCIYFELLGHPR